MTHQEKALVTVVNRFRASGPEVMPFLLEAVPKTLRGFDQAAGMVSFQVYRGLDSCELVIFSLWDGLEAYQRCWARMTAPDCPVNSLVDQGLVEFESTALELLGFAGREP